ncbi:MAG: PP2C family protein-serine/threonine phosphatase [Nocardioides sp.]
MFRLPWPRPLVVLAVLGAGLTLLVGGTAVFSLAGTVTTAEEMGQFTRAQRLHQDADMMHDALRADVGDAREALRTAAPTAAMERIRHATQNDAQQFEQDIRRLHKMDLPPAAANDMDALVPAQTEYIDTARRLVGSMLRTGKVDGAAIGRFETMFERLVQPQAEATLTLAESSADLEHAQYRHEQVIRRVLMIGSVAALVGWALLVGLHRREGARLRDALGREAAQRTVADQLQRSLFPDQLPDIPGLQLAARSTPGNSSMRVGGDWYDVVSLPSGEVGLVVGDVVGHDLSAASAMGQIRTALRAFAVHETSPATVLARVDTMVDILGVSDLTTCLYAIVNPATGAFRWSSAGHLNPLVIEASGEARLLRGDPGPPLGVSDTPVYVDRAAQIPPGGSVLIYTDGLVERRSSSISEGLARLESIRVPSSDPESVCDHVLASLLGLDSPASDDVTVLAIQPSPPYETSTRSPSRLGALSG